MKYVESIRDVLNSYDNDWEIISSMEGLPEDIIREYQYKVDWKTISSEQNLSESFIREFQDKVDWFFVSSHQNLSEPFIEEFKDKVHWRAISISQKLSSNFIIRYSEYLDADYLIKNDNLNINERDMLGILTAVKLTDKIKTLDT
jgi:hypothetical protein